MQASQKAWNNRGEYQKRKWFPDWFQQQGQTKVVLYKISSPIPENANYPNWDFIFVSRLWGYFFLKNWICRCKHVKRAQERQGTGSDMGQTRKKTYSTMPPWTEAGWVIRGRDEKSMCFCAILPLCSTILTALPKQACRGLVRNAKACKSDISEKK